MMKFIQVSILEYAFVGNACILDFAAIVLRSLAYNAIIALLWQVFIQNLRI